MKVLGAVAVLVLVVSLGATLMIGASQAYAQIGDQLSRVPQAILVLQSRFPNSQQTPVTNIYTYGPTPFDTLPSGGAIPPLGEQPGAAPTPSGAAPTGPKADLIAQLCPYFKWMPISDQCNIQERIALKNNRLNNDIEVD